VIVPVGPKVDTGLSLIPQTYYHLVSLFSPVWALFQLWRIYINVDGDECFWRQFHRSVTHPTAGLLAPQERCEHRDHAGRTDADVPGKFESTVENIHLC